MFKVGDLIHPYDPRGYFLPQVCVIVQAWKTQAWYRVIDSDLPAQNIDQRVYHVKHKEKGCAVCENKIG